MKNALLISSICLALGFTAQVPRLSLYEEFTGENCPPCAATNPGLDVKLANPTNTPLVVVVKWEVPIPSAPSATWSLYQTYKSAIDWRHKGWNGGYSSSSINPPSAQGYGYPSQSTSSANITSGVNSAPQGRFDGRHQWNFGATSNHPTYVSNQVIATAQAVPAAFHIVLKKEWNIGQTALTASVQITAASNFTAAGALVFRLVMVEKTITFSVAPGSNGEKVFHNVAIAAFPTLQNGTSMASTWAPGQTMSFIVNCPLPSYVRNKNEVDLVGFIQDDGNRKVEQAVRAKECTSQTIAVTSNKTKICKGESVTLTASGASNYSWNNNGGTGQSVVISPTAPAVYIVTSTDAGGCQNVGIFNVSLNDQTILTTSTKTTICAGESVTLSASGASSYSWTGGSTTQQIVVKPATTTTFVATSTDPLGCANKGEIAVTVNACTGLSSQEASGLRIYPNPSDGIFTVDGEIANIEKVVIYNALGQKVADYDLKNTQLPVTVRLTKGVYFYSLLRGQHTAGTGKLVVN